jgi:hypothetical protein
MKITRLLGLVLILAVSGGVTSCASTGTGQKDDSRRDLLTREQIMETGATNLHDVVNRLRPRWLMVRGTRSFSMETEIVVYQNDMLLGGPDALKQMSPELAHEIQYMDGTKAIASLPGLMSGRHIEGAIIVKTRGHGGG